MLNLFQHLRRQLGPVALLALAFASSTVPAQDPLGGPPGPPPYQPGTGVPPQAGGLTTPPPRQAVPNPASFRPEPLKPGEAVTQIVAPQTKLSLITLESIVIEVPNRIKLVDGHNPDVINIQALSPSQLRIRAEGTGVTKAKLIDEEGGVRELEILVETDTRELEAYMRRLFPGSAIEVYGIRDSIVLRGWVTDPTHIPRIVSVAETFAPKVHNQLDVAGTNQVQLQVKVIEVQRSKLREFGFNFVNTGNNAFVGNNIGGLAGLAGPAALLPNAAPQTSVNAAGLGNSELLFGLTSNNNAFQGFLKALQSEALAKVLAEPVLVTTSGRPASMLSGGQFPVLIPSGALGTATISWREFGIRLDAVPIVLGNGRLRLDVSPEVSDRDFSSGVSFNGLVVPGIVTRKVNTQVEMRFGETLMIGGLISTRRSGTTQKVPMLGELPIIGAAFSRKKYDWGETELLILVTPQMASPLSPMQVPEYGPGQMTEDPIDRELYRDGFLEIPRYAPEGIGAPEFVPPMADGIPYDMEPGPGNFYAPQLEEQPVTPGGETNNSGVIEQTSGVRKPASVVPAAGIRSADPPAKPRRRSLIPDSSPAAPGLIGPESR